MVVEEKNTTDLIELTAGLMSAYVSNNSVPAAELPALIAQIHASFSGLATGEATAPEEKPIPAIAIKKSIAQDYIVCLEDGKKFKSLKRHLMTHYGLTPDEYRAKWNLPADYPMVAPNYAATRSALAKRMGLGRKAKDPVKRIQKKAA
ncbi:MucR family transcriptional regulator [Phyllobacterium phragmitis]|uniref:MucR family transcriptional regulator n=1 Tax=Phyllobacterium phragmitis TaxID=2670329 RepID=A0A2S9IW23_9HYPH|nr:MucR family transcriptional regulator [Phyllobacterium phragmitis]PRD44725.1 MucR family transcriptional regulator [Phyllobacterium phragmitis]